MTLVLARRTPTLQFLLAADGEHVPDVSDSSNRLDRRKLEANCTRQIRAMRPTGFDADVLGRGKCGDCVFFEPRSEPGWCRMQALLVSANEQGCDAHELREV